MTALVHCSRDESCHGLAAIRRIRDTIRFRSAKHSRYDVLGLTRNSAEIRAILARDAPDILTMLQARPDVCGGKVSCRIHKDRRAAFGRNSWGTPLQRRINSRAREVCIKRVDPPNSKFARGVRSARVSLQFVNSALDTVSYFEWTLRLMDSL